MFQLDGTTAMLILQYRVDSVGFKKENGVRKGKWSLATMRMKKGKEENTMLIEKSQSKQVF